MSHCNMSGANTDAHRPIPRHAGSLRNSCAASSLDGGWQESFERSQTKTALSQTRAVASHII